MTRLSAAASRTIVLLFTLFLTISASVATFAQTVAGSIAGNVFDQSQAAIPHAQVTAVDQNKKTSRTIETDSNGRFVFAQMQPGTYIVSVEAQGFKRYERTGVILNGNEKLSVGDILLTVGAVSESIEVQAQAVELATESGERSATLNTKQLENVAVNSRSYLSLVMLTPGVATFPNLQTAGHSGVGAIAVNGARQNQNNLTLDGVGNVDTGNNGDQLATLSLDSVQEYRILTNAYQAEYGRSSGAQISVVTKSGTNTFHGSGYWFHRNEGLNANNWKNNRDGLPRKKFRFNDQGYTFGGPIFVPGHFNTGKDKLFFFVSEEFQRQLNPQTTKNQTVPTALERAGDFSQSVDKSGAPFPYIKDYTLNLPCSKANTSGCFQYQGVLGRINPARLYGPGLAILAAYPLPNAQQFQSSGYNFTSQISDSYPRREDLARFDFNLSQKWKLFARGVYNSDAVTSNYGSFVLGSLIPKVPITDARPGRAFAFSATTLISNTMTNELTWGFGKNIIHISPINDGLSRAKNGLTGLPVLYPNAITQDFIPTFAFNGTRINNTASWGTNNAPFFNYNSSIDWIDNLSKVWHQHSFKTGVYLQRSRKDQTAFASNNGTYNFGDGSCSGASCSNPFDSQYGFANAALGIYQTFSQASVYATGKYRYWNLEFYGQDTWKITRHLTLDYGLRMYWIQPQYDAGLQTSNFLPWLFDPKKAPALYQPGFDATGATVAIDPTTGAQLPSTAIGKIVPNSGDLLNGIRQAGKGVNKYLVQNRGLVPAPRLGFAYDVMGKERAVVRGGFGIFYDRFQGNEIFDEITNPPTTFSPTLFNGLAKDIDPKNALLGPSGLLGLSYNGKFPAVMQFNFGVQSKMPFGFVLDTAYVGSQSRHLLDKINLNAIPYGATYLPQNQDPTKLKASGEKPDPVTGLYSGANAKNVDFLRPYPGYGDISIHDGGTNSNYNSLQVSANRRFSKGLQFGLAYTWSRALGITSADNDFIRIDGKTKQFNYGPLSFDRSQTLVANWIYNIPRFFTGSFTHAVLDGWQIAGDYMAQSGSPFSVGFSIPGASNQLLTGSYTEGARIHLVGDPRAGTSSSPYNRVNPAAFAPPGFNCSPNVPCEPHDLGDGATSNYLRNPGINNWDMSIQKSFAIHERYEFQLRADAFNVWNHTQFSGINSTINYKSLTDHSITNLYCCKADGSINNINGFGTVSGARDPRIVQLVARFRF